MTLTGQDILKRRLGSVKRAIQDGSAFEAAGRAWLDEDFLPYAKQIAPVKSGEFRDSIGGEVNSNQIRVFAEAPYATDVEYGNSKREAQPTIRPALEVTRRKLSEHTRRELRKRI